MRPSASEVRLDGGAESLAQDLRRVASTNFGGLNLRDTIDFPVNKCAERILPSAAAVLASPLNTRAGTRTG